MANDPPGELEGLVAVVGFRRTQRAIEDFAGKCRRGHLLELLDQFAGRDQAAGAFFFGTDIGALKREVDASCRTVRLVRRHDLLAEKEAGLGGQLYA